MNNKRFCGIVLLAVLALLQVRVALAACTLAQPTSGTLSACCVGDQLSAQPSQPMADESCAIETCVASATALKRDARTLATAQAQEFAAAPPLATRGAYVSREPLRVSLTAAHPPHIPLIYVLQRLLI